MSILLSRQYLRTLHFPWLQKVKFRLNLNPWSPEELWKSKWEMELPILVQIFCTWYLLFLLPLFVCYFYLTKLAKLIYFLTSWVRFHRFHFFSVYTNQFLSLSCIICITVNWSLKECLTCNLQLQGPDFPASPFAPFIPASPLLPLSPFSP